jgi:hypothetical protein
MVTYISGVTIRRGMNWMIIYCTYTTQQLHVITALSLIYTLYSSPSHTRFLNLH